MTDWTKYSKDIQSNLYLTFLLGNKIDKKIRLTNINKANELKIKLSENNLKLVLNYSAISQIEDQLGHEFVLMILEINLLNILMFDGDLIHHNLEKNLTQLFKSKSLSFLTELLKSDLPEWSHDLIRFVKDDKKDIEYLDFLKKSIEKKRFSITEHVVFMKMIEHVNPNSYKAYQLVSEAFRNGEYEFDMLKPEQLFNTILFNEQKFDRALINANELKFFSVSEKYIENVDLLKLTFKKQYISARHIPSLFNLVFHSSKEVSSYALFLLNSIYKTNNENEIILKLFKLNGIQSIQLIDYILLNDILSDNFDFIKFICTERFKIKNTLISGIENKIIMTSSNILLDTYGQKSLISKLIKDE